MIKAIGLESIVNLVPRSLVGGRIACDRECGAVKGAAKEHRTPVDQNLAVARLDCAQTEFRGAVVIHVAGFQLLVKGKKLWIEFVPLRSVGTENEFGHNSVFTGLQRHVVAFFHLADFSGKSTLHRSAGGILHIRLDPDLTGHGIREHLCATYIHTVSGPQLHLACDTVPVALGMVGDAM